MDFKGTSRKRSSFFYCLQGGFERAGDVWYTIGGFEVRDRMLLGCWSIYKGKLLSEMPFLANI